MAESLVGTRIAVIGGGKMGEALVGGLIASSEKPADCLDRGNFAVANPGEQRRAYLKDRYGVECVAGAEDIQGAHIVILAVKPQVMMEVIANIADLPAYGGGCSGPLFVSIAAGLTTKRLEDALPAGARVVRVMPNMPLQVGAGATAVTGGANATEADVELVRSLFACLGYACVVDEGLMDAVCAVSGSGPAYVAAVIEALSRAGEEQGLDPQLAQALALQTVYGTAKVLMETGQTPAFLRESVCSPGGTTLAALEAMHGAGFSEVFDKGVRAAVRRSKELGAC